MDSAYWQEWKLMNPNDENGIYGFLLWHFPIIIIILLGLVFVYDKIFIGLIISLLLSACGIFAFFFHFHHLTKGKQEFNTLLSKGLIVSTFGVSIFQIILTIMRMVK
jgi:hypothetical protein